MRTSRLFSAVDSHTEGMPTRVVTGGIGVIPGATMNERRLHFIEHLDGFKSLLLHDTGSANSEWVTAWSEEGRKEHQATVHYTQEARPFAHFTLLTQGIEQMIFSAKPTWPVERTLLVTGVLAAAFQSRKQGGVRLDTPHLAISYKPTFTWKEPPPLPPDRPMQGQ